MVEPTPNNISPEEFSDPSRPVNIPQHLQNNQAEAYGIRRDAERLARLSGAAMGSQYPPMPVQQMAPGSLGGPISTQLGGGLYPQQLGYKQLVQGNLANSLYDDQIIDGFDPQMQLAGKQILAETQSVPPILQDVVFKKPQGMVDPNPDDFRSNFIRGLQRDARIRSLYAFV